MPVLLGEDVNHPMTTEPTPFPESTIGAYLAGELDAETAERVRAYLEATPQQRAYVAYLRASLRGEIAGGPPDLHAARGRLFARLDHAAAVPAAAPFRTTRTRGIGALRGWTGYATAAVAAVLLVVGGVTLASRASHRDASTTHRYATRPGQRAVITLADGSEVTLAPATTVRATVSARGVAVSVDGEALFRVAHRADASFTVQTRNAVTRVLGTTFLVRQYGTDARTQVVVADGRVSLLGQHRTATRDAVLSANTVGVVDDSGRVDVVPTASTDTYMAWTTGVLIFEQAPASRIVADLGRAYGVDVRIADSVLARHIVTWSVPVTRVTLAGALRALSAVIDAHVVRAGDTITLVPGRGGAARPHTHDSLSTQERTYGR